MAMNTSISSASMRRIAKSILLLILASLRVWWIVVIGFIVVGLIAGYLLSSRYSTTTWEATGIMLYAPPPMAETAKGLYAAPDLNTILPLAKSPEVMSKIRDDFELTVPLNLLEKLFKVTAPRGSQSVTVTLQWGEPDKASEMVNRLMWRYSETIRGYRQQKVSKYIDDFEARRQYCMTRRKASAESLDAMLRLNNISDIPTEEEVVRKSIDRFQTNKTYALRDEAAYVAQRIQMIEELEKFRKKDSEDAEANKQYDAEMESVSDARRRQDRLRELIEDERQKAVWQSELKVRRSDYERVRDLHDKGAASLKEVELSKKEVDILLSKLNDNKKIESWKDELTKIDQTVVPKNKSKAGGSPIIQQALFRKLELDLKLTGIQKELDTAEAGIIKERSRLAELHEFELRTNSIRKDIESMDTEREKLSDQIGLFTRLRDQTATEFTVISPATTGQNPVSSNRKYIFIACVLASLFLAICTTAILQRFYGVQSTSYRINMPELDSLGEMDSESLVKQRLVVSRLRDAVSDYGAKILVTGDGSGMDVLPWIIRLSRRLAARDERILIIDCRLSEADDVHTSKLLGLGDYLHWKFDDLNAIIIQDDFAGVELLPAGLSGDIDMLACHRMKDVIAKCSSIYSLVFLVATTNFRPDVYDLLSRFSHAILAVLTSDASSKHIHDLKSQIPNLPLWSIMTKPCLETSSSTVLTGKYDISSLCGMIRTDSVPLPTSTVLSQDSSVIVSVQSSPTSAIVS